MNLQEKIEEFARQSIALYVGRLHSSDGMRNAAEALELEVKNLTGETIHLNRHINEE